MKKKLLLVSCLLTMSVLSSCGETPVEKINWHSGTQMPSSTISAKSGDYYYDIDDGLIYSYTNSSWKLVVTLGGGNNNSSKSAYELYISIHNDYEKTEEEWESDLRKGLLEDANTFDVVFNPNNGEYSFTKIVTENKKVEKPTDPTNGDLEFLGWYDKNDELWIFGGNSVTSDVTLTAKWGNNSNTGGSTDNTGGSTDNTGGSTDDTGGSSDNTNSGSEDTGSSTPSYETITIDEAIEIAKSLVPNTSTTDYYYIEGTIFSIWNSTYGNMNLGSTDNPFTIYGSYSSDGTVAYADMSAKPLIDDEIVFYGKITHFYDSSKSKTQYEVVDAWLMSINGVAIKADGTLTGSTDNTGGDDNTNPITPINPNTQWTNSDFGNYYESIDFSNNDTLLSQLQTLDSKKHTRTITYSNLWNYFDQTDYYPSDTSKYIAFYKGTASSKSSMNKEHVWPKSHGGHLVEDDLHAIRPTISADNSSRGNSFYVEGMNHESNGWDPKTAGMEEQYRGQAARIVFYCVVAESRLSLIDESYSATSNANPDYKMGKLSDLLRWNLQYAVDQTELNRNNGAEDVQGNRNPFIDNPYLACAIWGNYNDATRAICAEYDVIVDPYTGDITLPDGSGNTGNTDNDSGNTGDNSGNSGEDSGNTGDNTGGNTGDDSGNTGGATDSTNGYYVKVAENQTDWSGKYLIVHEGSNEALNPNVENVNSKNNYLSITIYNGTVEWTQTLEDISVTISSTSGGYTIKTSSGKFLGSTVTSNAISLSDTELVNTISFVSADDISIASSSNTYLRYNASWPGFRYYKSGQEAIQLYKYVEA